MGDGNSCAKIMGPLMTPIVVEVDEHNPLRTNIPWSAAFRDPNSERFFEVSRNIIDSLDDAYEEVVNSMFEIRNCVGHNSSVTNITIILILTVLYKSLRL